MGKILKPGTTCNSCGLKENAEDETWIKSNYGLYSFCKKCIKKGQPCISCIAKDKQPSEQPCASCHKPYDGFNWWNYHNIKQAFNEHQDCINGIDKLEKMYNL